MQYPSHLSKVIHLLKRLPGVGFKSAERYAFHLLEWSESHLNELSHALHDIPHKIQQCKECGCLKDQPICPFCIQEREQSKIICIISSPREAFFIESTGEYKGLYHVLGGLLSPLAKIGPEKLSIFQLKERIIRLKINEIVIALDSTLEGDTTALFLREELASLKVIISRLAVGLPIGSPIDYVDGGTLARAFSARNKF